MVQIMGIVCLFIGISIITGIARAKFAELYNPIKKYQKTDYRFCEVPIVKTRNMFS